MYPCCFVPATRKGGLCALLMESKLGIVACLPQPRHNAVSLSPGLQRWSQSGQGDGRHRDLCSRGREASDEEHRPLPNHVKFFFVADMKTMLLTLGYKAADGRDTCLFCTCSKIRCFSATRPSTATSSRSRFSTCAVRCSTWCRRCMTGRVRCSARADAAPRSGKARADEQDEELRRSHEGLGGVLYVEIPVEGAFLLEVLKRGESSRSLVLEEKNYFPFLKK